MPMMAIMVSANAAWRPTTLTSVRKNGSLRYLCNQTVANSTHCFQNITTVCRTQFMSKIFDMNIYYVTKADIIEIPQMTQKIFPINNLIGTAHEIFKQTVFLQRQRDFFAAAH